jgi:transcriptional regulator with XRE-family HTH domain
LGDRLRKARHVAGLQQRDVAKYLGLSSAAVGMYELDVRVPKLGMVRLWAMLCGVPLEWLLGDDNAQSTNWLTAVAA